MKPVRIANDDDWYKRCADRSLEISAVKPSFSFLCRIDDVSPKLSDFVWADGRIKGLSTRAFLQIIPLDKLNLLFEKDGVRFGSGQFGINCWSSILPSGIEIILCERHGNEYMFVPSNTNVDIDMESALTCSEG